MRVLTSVPGFLCAFYLLKQCLAVLNVATYRKASVVVDLLFVLLFSGFSNAAHISAT